MDSGIIIVLLILGITVLMLVLDVALRYACRRIKKYVSFDKTLCEFP